MGDFLFAGAVLGALIGLCHAVQIYRGRIADGREDPVVAGYYAVWTFALWTIFGAYVLAFWLIGIGAMAISRMVAGGAR